MLTRQTIFREGLTTHAQKDPFLPQLPHLVIKMETPPTTDVSCWAGHLLLRQYRYHRTPWLLVRRDDVGSVLFDLGYFGDVVDRFSVLVVLRGHVDAQFGQRLQVRLGRRAPLHLHRPEFLHQRTKIQSLVA